MKSLAILLVLCLVALVLGPGCDAATTPRPKASAKCATSCDDSWKPVCGKTGASTTEITFGNECVLNKVACESGKAATKLRDGECGKNAPVRLA